MRRRAERVCFIDLSADDSGQIPAVLFYERVDTKELLAFDSLPLSGNSAILSEDITISR